MNAHASLAPANAEKVDPAMADTEALAASPALAETVDRAGRRIAPLWPLRHFVAVNPFLGLTGKAFPEAAASLKRVGGIDMVMPRAFYREALAAGRLPDEALAAALAAHAGRPGVPADVPALKAALSAERAAPAPAATVAEVVDAATGRDTASLVVDEVSRFCAAHYDEGQSAWRSPFRDMPLFSAFKAQMAHDRTAETMGVKGFRKTVAALPDDPVEAIAAVVRALAVPPEGREAYFHKALLTVGGWAAWARYRLWEAELHGGTDGDLVGLLAVRLAWDHALMQAFETPAVARAWADARARLAGDAALAEAAEALAVDLVLQEAFETAFQTKLVEDVATAMTASKASAPAGARKPLQAAFCIDVRSEIYRRALESVMPEAETVGFAGFFGVPIEYVPLGADKGGAQCPVLLTPQFRIAERVAGADDATEAEILEKRRLSLAVGKAWKAFKTSAVSSFVFVETIGLAFAAKLVGDGAGLTRTVAHPKVEGLDASAARRLKPELVARGEGENRTGLDEDTRVAVAKAVLTAMSMTKDFGRIVLLAGHGSTTVNNPHATGLDCGACGGHTGEANARIAALLLNDPVVRARLPGEGIAIPEDTWFLAGQHDTTTDEVTIFDEADVPASHAADLAALKETLKKAASLARAERAHLLGIDADGPDAAVDGKVLRRSRDWSEVRPEWGLAGNAAFIAAPRSRTAGLKLSGRAFLHNYVWQDDPGFSVLELIMTAPMVVASWINLQYYGSVVDNVAFGSGNKVLHNVVGTIGVLEGNGGDLRTGLPFQSVHDGERYVHEPLRLNVFIEAPVEEMNRIIGKHAGVAELVDNGWVHLWALSAEGAPVKRYAGNLRWVDATPAAAAAAA